MWSSQESRTVYDVSQVFFNRFYQQGIFSRIVLEVGILNNNDVTRGFAEPPMKRTSFTLILFLKKNLDLVLRNSL